MDTVICKEVIITTQSRRGDGKDNPIRVITEVFEKDGTKIAEHDPSPEYDARLIGFAKWCIASKISSPTFADISKWCGSK